MTVWEDSAFNPAGCAFYYARVIEVPTPRWTDYYEAKRFQINMLKEGPMSIHKCACTSPICYTP